MVAVFIFLILLSGIILPIIRCKRRGIKVVDAYGAVVTVPIMAFMLFIFIMFWSRTYIDSIDAYAEVKSFVESDIPILYAAAVQGQVDASVIGDLSNHATGPKLIDNIQELVHKIKEVNETILFYKHLNQHFFFDGFVYDWPEYPELIQANSIIDNIGGYMKNIENINSVMILKSIP